MSEDASGYPSCDPATVAPTTTRDGITYPDLYNHMPLRQVTLAEAKARKWVYFYVAESCRYGHLSGRYVSNPRMCVDCSRENGRKPAIGKMAEGLPRPKRKITPPGRTAKPKDEPIDTSRVLALSGQPYQWTDAKRARLLEVWTDTGDIAAARDAVEVTPSEYLRELERNEKFAEQVKKTELLANRILVERAYHLALKGNDKLISKLLPAIDPEKFSERVKLDVNQTGRLSDDAIDARLGKLLAKQRGNILDGEFVEIGKARALAAPRGEVPAGVEEQDQDPVPGKRTVS
jgi:hypothetical protein